METIEATVVGAFWGGRRSEVGGMWFEKLSISTAGTTGGRRGPPWWLGEGQSGPWQRAGRQIAFRWFRRPIMQVMRRCWQGVIVVITDHWCPDEKEKGQLKSILNKSSSTISADTYTCLCRPCCVLNEVLPVRTNSRNNFTVTLTGQGWVKRL